jgi:hypothetical protein
MQPEYGQKAPQLSDGSVLLNEVILTAEQTSEVKHDIDLTRSVIDEGKRATKIMVGVALTLALGHIGAIVAAIMGMSALGLIFLLGALLISAEVNKRIYRNFMKASSVRLQAIKSRPTVASVVRNFWATMSAGAQSGDHMTLMLEKEVRLGGGGAYSLVMDQSSEDNYVLRLVQKPAKEAVAV